MKSLQMASRASTWCVLALAICGCAPLKMSVDIRNGTAEPIKVTSSETGRSVHILARHSEAISHSSGDLIVTTAANRQFRFEDVRPDTDGPDSPFNSSRDAFGPISGKFVLHVLLDTNMDLFAILPGQSVVTDAYAQPRGYPKRGQELIKQK